MPKSEQLGERLAQERREKAVRERRDITAAEVAREIGVSTPTYSRYEANLTKPDDDTLARAAKYLGVTRSWLRFGEGEKYAAPPIVKETESERDVTGPTLTSKRAAGAGRRSR